MSKEDYKSFQRAKAFNLEITRTETPTELLQLISKKLMTARTATTSRKKEGLNYVNYCTALNRLAKYSNNVGIKGRKSIDVSTDVRFALFMQSLGLKLSEPNQDANLGGREIAGIVWALGKILKGYVVNGGEGIEISRGSMLEYDSKELGELMIEAGKDSVKRESKIWVEGVVRVSGGIVGTLLETDKNGGRNWKEQEISNYAHGLGNLRVYAPSELSWVNMSIKKKPRGMSQEYANVMWSNAVTLDKYKQMGKGDYEDTGFWGVVEEAGRRLPNWELKNQEISIMAYATAVVWKFEQLEGLGSQESDRTALDFFEKLVKKSEGLWRGFKPQEISNFLWSCATLEATSTPSGKLLFSSLSSLACSKLPGFGNLELQNLVWSVSKGGDPELVFPEVCKVLPDRAPYLNPQDVSVLLSSFSRAGWYDKSIFDLLAGRIGSGKFYSPQHLSNCISGLAGGGFGPEEGETFKNVFECVANEVKRRGARVFKTQEIKDVLWSFSKVGASDDELFQIVVSDLLDRDSSGESMESISIAMYAIAKLGETGGSETKGGKLGIFERFQRVLGSDGPDLFCKLIKCVDVKRCASMDLTNMVYAMGLVGYLDEEFFRAVAEEVEILMRKGARFDAIQINNFLWGLSTTGCEIDVSGVVDWVDENFDNIKWSPTELSSIIWSLFVRNMAANHESLVRKAWDKCIEGREELNQQSLMSLIQVQVIADIIYGMRLEFGNGWKGKDVDPGVSISKLQKDVLAMLESNNGKGKGRWNWREEVMIGEVEDSLNGKELVGLKHLSVDIADVERKVCVEVQGPSHYVLDLGNKGGARGRNRINGSTKMKLRLLERLGWKCICVEYWRWNTRHEEERLKMLETEGLVEL